MSVTLVTVHNQKYQPLADHTVENKREYCTRHGYNIHVVEDGGEQDIGKKICVCQVPPPPSDQLIIGWSKIFIMKQAMDKYPDTKWIFNTDCDAMITNMTIKIEDIVKQYNEDTHIIIPADCNGINCGNILIRNSPIGRAFLDVIIASEPLYRNWYLYENQCIQDLTVGSFLTEQGVREGGTLWSLVARVIPQRIMNSYDYKNLPQFKKPLTDIFGNDGQWKKGDFMIQWPSNPLEYRLKVAPIYKELVVR